MGVRSPLGNQRSFFALLLFIASIIIVVGALGFYLINTKNFPFLGGILNSLGANARTTPTTNGEQINLSEGAIAFDTNRPDGSLKQQAADQFKQGHIEQAKNLWVQAHDKDTTDAEVLIYLEDQIVKASGKPYITLVVGTMLTGDDSSAVGTGRDNLQGAYIAQKQCNDGYQLNTVLIRLIIANAGSQSSNAATIARQIVQEKNREGIVGVMGWPFSAYALNVVTILSDAHIPMVSPTASSDALSGKSSFFFRVVPPNKTQAIIGAQYAANQLGAKRAALFLDPNNSYSNSLATNFAQQFTADGNHMIVAKEEYTRGKPGNLNILLQQALGTNPDLIYFSGYANDLSVLLTDLTDMPTSQPNIQIMGGDALYELNGYTASARAGFTRLHFTSFAYPDEWDYLNRSNEKPAFFTVYAYNFDPTSKHLGAYGYSRADGDTILSYDATKALIEGCKNGLNGRTSLTSDDLQQGLTRVTGTQGIQGVGGQISFSSANDTKGDPINKAVVILQVAEAGNIMIAPNNPIQGCFLLGACGNT